MAWERRGKRVYYYRGVREDGRVVKKYLGRGPQAEKAAKEDAARRAARTEQRQAEQRRRDAYELISQQVMNFAGRLAAMFEAALSAAGYHQHDRGPWRRRRGTSKIREED